jgi:hypothetical protein
MSSTKIYHIYLKDECVLHSLSEENFRSSWETLQNLVGLVKTDYQAEDLSYEVVDVLQEGVDISNLSDTSQWLTEDYILGIMNTEMEWF